VGKAQRILSQMDTSGGPLIYQEAVERVNAIYRGQGIALPHATEGGDLSQALVIASPQMQGSAWLRRFGKASMAFASGWMRIRGTRRRRSLDRGFVISDHADWPGLLQAIGESGAENVWVTHGYVGALVRWLEENGKRAVAVELKLPAEEAAE
jgi:putative mRNA 3-end processing factor